MKPSPIAPARFMSPPSAEQLQLTSPSAMQVLPLHDALPLTERPFADIGAELGISEDAVIERLRHLLARGTLTRFGPLFQIERAGGLFVLAALEVPEADFARITALVNALPEVAHNYRREHRLNMWFVLACEKPDQIEQAAAQIEGETGLTVLRFPKLKEFFIGFRVEA